MARFNIVSFIVFSLVLSLTLSVLKSAVLHPMLMDHAQMVSQNTTPHHTATEYSVPLVHQDHLVQSHNAQNHADHLSTVSSITDQTNDQSADDCRLKCISAMCVTNMGAVFPPIFDWPSSPRVYRATLTVVYPQFHAENLYRPPITA